LIQFVNRLLYNRMMENSETVLENPATPGNAQKAQAFGHWGSFDVLYAMIELYLRKQLFEESTEFYNYRDQG